MVRPERFGITHLLGITVRNYTPAGRFSLLRCTLTAAIDLTDSTGIPIHNSLFLCIVAICLVVCSG